MNRTREQRDFQAILESTDWISYCGVEPTISHYEEYLNILPTFSKNKVKPSFQDFFTFCIKLYTADKDESDSGYLQGRIGVPDGKASDAWRKFCATFKRQPTFVDYVDFVNECELTRWTDYQCPRPTFEDYLGYLIECDTVTFDWIDMCGHRPMLTEYMAYLGVVDQVDWTQIEMEKPSFRQVLQEGSTGLPLKAKREELEDGEISDEDSPLPSSSSQRSPDYGSSSARPAGSPRHYRSPTKRPKSPDRRTVSPRTRSPSHRGRSGSPSTYVQSPEKRSRSPRRRSSSRKRSRSPAELPKAYDNRYYSRDDDYRDKERGDERYKHRSHRRSEEDRGSPTERVGRNDSKKYSERRNTERRYSHSDESPTTRRSSYDNNSRRSPRRYSNSYTRSPSPKNREIRSPRRSGRSDYDTRHERKSHRPARDSSPDPEETRKHLHEAMKSWHNLMMDYEKDRFDYKESGREDGEERESEHKARYTKNNSVERMDCESEAKEGEVWCGQCGMYYSRSDEKNHRLQYHEHKSEVFRCAECGWDHASYQLLFAHYDLCHPHIRSRKRPHKTDCRISVPSIVVLPRCNTCSYGTLIPFANSYHNCEKLPVFQNGYLVIEKERECIHNAGDKTQLCARCESYFSPPLAQIRYEQGQFIIDVGQSFSTEEMLKPTPLANNENLSDTELTIDVEPINEKTSTLGSELKKLFSPNRERKESVSVQSETEQNSYTVENQEEPERNEQTEMETDQVENLNRPDVEEKPVKPRVKTPVKKFRCRECSFEFAKKPNMLRHHKFHHAIKDRALRCRQCGMDFIVPQGLHKHYKDEHYGVKMGSIKRHEVFAKPYVNVPVCTECKYQSLVPHAMKYHQCTERPVYDNTKLRIKCPNLCTHTEEPGDLCEGCVGKFTPTERRVKYDCAREEYVITVREKLVSSKQESDDDIESGDDENASDGEVPDTSDESDENEETKALRDKFCLQQTKSFRGLTLHECRFCGKRKSRKTLIQHIKKFHCTKFHVIRCHFCGHDVPTYQELRCHWRKRHDFYTPKPRQDVEYISEPYEHVPVCQTCHFQTLIPYAMQLHTCEQLPVLKDDVLHIEKPVKCEHAQDIKYSYGLGATSAVCADCVRLFVPNPEKVKLENGVFKIQVTQKLTRDDPEFQAQRDKRTEEKNKKVGMGAGLLVSKKRLKDRSCTDLVTGIELKERYFCVVHAKEFKSAEAQIQHNCTMHARLPITEAYRCFLCAYDGNNFNVAKKHALQFHKEECIDNTLFIVKVTLTGCQKIAMCKTCGYASMDNDIFKDHECYFWAKNRKEKTEVKKHMCPVCQTAFRSESHVQKHIDDMHTKWLQIFRCFICGYDSETFDVIANHIYENHDRSKGSVLEEDCSMAVHEFLKIPACKTCGFATLIGNLFQNHKCYFWPEVFFRNNVPKDQKPGPHIKPLWEETVDNPMKPLPKSDIPRLMDLPAIPVTWKPNSHSKINSKAHSSSSNSKPRPRSSSSRHRSASSSVKHDGRHSSRKPDRRDIEKERSKRNSREDSRERDRYKRQRTDETQSGNFDQRSYQDQGHSRAINQYNAGSSRQGQYPDERDTNPDATVNEHDSYLNGTSSNMYEFNQSPASTQTSIANDLLKEAWANYYQYVASQNASDGSVNQYNSQSGNEVSQGTSYSEQSVSVAEQGRDTPQNDQDLSYFDFSTLDDKGKSTPPADTKCPHCFAVLQTEKAKEDHVYDQHEVKTTIFRCPTCFLDTTFYNKLKQHFKKKHKSMKKVDISETKVKHEVEPFTYVPLCPRGCGFASLDANAIRYHRCFTNF